MRGKMRGRQPAELQLLLARAGCARACNPGQHLPNATAGRQAGKAWHLINNLMLLPPPLPTWVHSASSKLRASMRLAAMPAT